VSLPLPSRLTGWRTSSSSTTPTSSRPSNWAQHKKTNNQQKKKNTFFPRDRRTDRRRPRSSRRRSIKTGWWPPDGDRLSRDVVIFLFPVADQPVWSPGTLGERITFPDAPPPPPPPPKIYGHDGDLVQQRLTQQDTRHLGGARGGGCFALLTILLSWLTHAFRRLRPLKQTTPHAGGDPCRRRAGAAVNSRRTRVRSTSEGFRRAVEGIDRFADIRLRRAGENGLIACLHRQESRAAEGAADRLNALSRGCFTAGRAPSSSPCLKRVVGSAPDVHETNRQQRPILDHPDRRRSPCSPRVPVLTTRRSGSVETPGRLVVWVSFRMCECAERLSPVWRRPRRAVFAAFDVLRGSTSGGVGGGGTRTTTVTALDA